MGQGKQGGEEGGVVLIPWHSAVLPVYLPAVGQNALSESCGCFRKAGQATFIWNLLNLAALKEAMSISVCLAQQYQ